MSSPTEVAMAKSVSEKAKSKASGKLNREEMQGVEVYRRLALSFPYVVESAHMGAPDFRIERAGNQRIFATLAYGAKGLGTLMLNAEQQERFLAEAPEYFSAAPGGWGRMGATLVRVDAPESVLAGALSTAYQHVLEKMSAKKTRTAKAKTRV